MNETAIEQFKQELRRLRSELQEQEEFKETGFPVEPDQARVGRLSRMRARKTQQMWLERGRRRTHRLVMIEGAFRRIRIGEYGYCAVCGGEIDIGRLSVDPVDTRCGECAGK